LEEGKHILFVDFDPDQEQILNQVVSSHPGLKDAGLGSATPKLVVMAQQKWSRFMQLAP
jgi:hypothetical protein